MLLQGVNTGSVEYGAVLSTDQLRLYFDSDRQGNMTHTFFASRTDPSVPFAGAARIDELSSSNFDSDSTLTGDELTILFSSTRDGRECIYESARPDLATAWSMPVRHDELCPSLPVSGPYLTADGLRVYFNTSEDGLGEGTLYYAERTARGAPFGAAIPLAGFDTTPRGYPVLGEDELTMWFEQADPSQLQVFETHRTSRAAPFDPPARTNWMGAASEYDPTVTRDGRALVFSSSYTGNGDMYLITRPCE